jgi:hypothetical protein
MMIKLARGVAASMAGLALVIVALTASASAASAAASGTVQHGAQAAVTASRVASPAPQKTVDSGGTSPLSQAFGIARHWLGEAASVMHETAPSLPDLAWAEGFIPSAAALAVTYCDINWLD